MNILLQRLFPSNRTRFGIPAQQSVDFRLIQIIALDYRKWLSGAEKQVTIDLQLVCLQSNGLSDQMMRLFNDEGGYTLLVLNDDDGPRDSMIIVNPHYAATIWMHNLQSIIYSSLNEQNRNKKLSLFKTMNRVCIIGQAIL